MKASEHLDDIASDEKQEAVWKTAKFRTSYLAANRSKLRRIAGEAMEEDIELAQKTKAGASGFGVIPV